jgi:hypothetical protein
MWRWDWKIKILRKKTKKIVKMPHESSQKKLEILQNMPHFCSDFIVQKHHCFSVFVNGLRSIL